MDNLAELAGSLAARLAQGLGLKPSEVQRLKAHAANLEQNQRDTQDRWEALKEEIRRVEARLMKKKGEYEAAHGLVQKMVGEEIEQLFAQLDRKTDQMRLVSRNASAIAMTLDKLRELEHASADGVKEGQLDDITDRLEGAVAELQQADTALSDLERVGYKGREQARPDLERRLSEIEGARSPAAPLSSGTIERLKQLEKEMES